VMSQQRVFWLVTLLRHSIQGPYPCTYNSMADSGLGPPSDQRIAFVFNCTSTCWDQIVQGWIGMKYLKFSKELQILN
jgi:hypothetical protein